jgi:hypothetical protein
MIKRIHAARATVAAASPTEAPSTSSVAPGPQVADGGESPESVSAYDRARRHLLQHEEEDRRRAWLTDRILDQLTTTMPASSARDSAGAAPTLLQSEIRLSCVVNGRAAGRFRIVNSTGSEVELDLRSGRVHGAPPGWDRRLPVRFEQPPGSLRAGEERIVKIVVDTAGCPLRPGNELELAVDVVGGGRLLHKVWVSIQVSGEPS